jgi:hypothetical protein
MVEETKVFVGIPTGPPKWYSLLLLAASIQNLDAEIELHIATTDGGGNEPARFYSEIQQAFTVSRLPFTLHRVFLTEEEMGTPYLPILKNREKLRDEFLDSDCEEFFMVGGDNPPHRKAVKILRALDADVAFGVSYQRPKVDQEFTESYPLLWKMLWTMKDVPEDIPRDMRQDFRKLLMQQAIQVPIYLDDPDWKTRPVLEDVVGGDGNCLIRREVLEEIPWTLPVTSWVSEDLLFMRTALAYGYTVKCDPRYHVPHFHDGDLRGY